MMDIPVPQARAHTNPSTTQRAHATRVAVAAPPPTAAATGAVPAGVAAPRRGAAMRLNRSAAAAPPPIHVDNFTIAWNGTDFYYNVSDSSELDYDYQMTNGTLDDSSWSLCKEWTPAQHNLFQTANFFFAAAFLVPGTFKQSVLLVRALLSIGCFLIAIWGGTDVCALDILLWNCIQVVLNCTHTALLVWRFLPPTLTLELTDLYIKVFKPLKVSKKHFKELVKEARVMSLEQGDIYAVEDVSPADERLSILLKGRLKVTCDDTHLHWVAPHQFVDSPEWEANREQSDDVFQVTITAEEDSVYLCWPRMRLERVLRHRPKLKVVLDSIIGKDITQKLYALNEHLMGMSDGRVGVGSSAKKRKEAHARSISMDAVDTGTTGLVRSVAWRQKTSPNSGDGGSLDKYIRRAHQRFVPPVANQFPASSPFVPAAVKTSAAVAAANAAYAAAATTKAGGHAQGAAGPAHGAAGPAHGAAGPAHGAAGPAHGAAGPAHGAGGPAHGAAGPAHGAAGPAHGAAGPAPAGAARPSTGAIPKAGRPSNPSTGAIPKQYSLDGPRPTPVASKVAMAGLLSAAKEPAAPAGVAIPMTSATGALRPLMTPPRARASGVKEVKFEPTPSTSRR